MGQQQSLNRGEKFHFFHFLALSLTSQLLKPAVAAITTVIEVFVASFVASSFVSASSFVAFVAGSSAELVDWLGLDSVLVASLIALALVIYSLAFVVVAVEPSLLPSSSA